MKEILLKNVYKSYKDTPVIENLNLEIKEGERLVLLGPSGCGKSTILRMIAGLETISSGELYLNGKNATNMQSGHRNIAMVFQNYALYPNMTVSENITFGLKASKIDKEEVNRRLEKVLDMLDLKKYKDRLPKELSGGQRQRVALARSVVKRSNYFLLDEPLSNLDVTLRHNARKQLIKIHEMYKHTFVYVTHDQVEAMTIGHRIALLNEGKIQMIDTPEKVYNYPSNIFTASFIGNPKMNLKKIKLEKNRVIIKKQSILINDVWEEVLKKNNNSNLIVGTRPEHLKISKEKVDNSIFGVIKFIENLGPNYAIVVDVDGDEWIVLDDYKNWEIGNKVSISFNDYKLHFFNENTENNIGYPKEVENYDNLYKH
ncbi:MAG: ABC transporter ATP-binding protein [Miniphocaeibacter sp.]|uniref:ABC transporter ATP-binding protein n=1 Tax=Miniphocaeibacter sp. TaxID=3100973 RepID=UPI00182826FC|nr:ABC transporter ATP-binding protein [Gallicola sp.]